MHGEQQHDIDILFDRLVNALNEAKGIAHAAPQADALEARLFAAHDAVMADLAKARTGAGAATLGYTEAVEALDAVYSDTVDLLRSLAGGAAWGFA